MNTKTLDLTYLCTTIGNMSGVPIRIYQDSKLTFYHTLISLPKDPILLHEDKILAVTNPIGYFITPEFDYYGIAHIQDITIVLGPARLNTPTEQELRKIAFELEIAPDQINDFLSGMKVIVHMPLESLLQILCMIYYTMTGKKISLNELEIIDSTQNELSKELLLTQDKSTFTEENDNPDVHNTYQIEQQITDIVRRGDSIALAEWMKHAPAIRSGKVAPDMLRQMKNTFIVTITLISRAAIRGGMDVDDAFRLSDSYIQKCEQLYNYAQIVNLQYHMIQHYTHAVEELRYSRNQSELMTNVASYVRHHLSDAIKTDDIAAALFISRSHLSTRFKQESGMNLSEYITQLKMSEAKHLLAHSDKNLSLISAYLGFSSQSHFCRVFKKYAGMLPKEFREQS